jgi:hypothetical protein
MKKWSYSVSRGLVVALKMKFFSASRDRTIAPRLDRPAIGYALVSKEDEQTADSEEVAR